jgi:hypothetical protein
MAGFVILVAVAAIYYPSGHDTLAGGRIWLAQATTPNVTAPLTGLATPLTSTVTNCMMSCNAQAANCQTSCFVPAPTVPPPTPISSPAPIFNATVSPACTTGCSATQLACQTNCARLSPGTP